MRRLRAPWLIALGIITVGAPKPTAAQGLPQSLAADRARIAEITGDTADRARPGEIPLMEWAPWLREFLYLDRVPVFVLPPEFRSVHNSALPYSFNDGALWAGRGFSFLVSGGFGSRLQRWGFTVTAAVAPTLAYSQNLAFQILPGASPDRSTFSSPFHGPIASADLPLRFGDQYQLMVHPGRSYLSVEGKGVRVRLTARDEIWGPGIRNALVVSSHAPGIPRIELGPATRFRTRVGQFDGKLIAGVLTESLFFDRIETNDLRSISGLLVQWHPPADSNLTIGLARVVYEPMSRTGVLQQRALDVLTHWQGARTMAGPQFPTADQVSSVFGRWVFPDAGLELYGEYARMLLPRTLTEALTALHYSGGYTVGLQWVTRPKAASRVRVQGEATYLEQSRAIEGPQIEFYTAGINPHGFTNRGQMVGASIGPGASSQSIGIDFLRPRWQVGTFAMRIRWENDVLYRIHLPTLFKHDVSVHGGFRGGVRTPRVDITAEATFAYRYNYLFQNGFTNFGGYRTVDARSLTYAVSVTPR